MTKRRDFIKKSLFGSAGIATVGIGFSPELYPSNDAHESEDTNLNTVEALRDYAITHGGIQLLPHHDLGVDVYGETCIRYLRFGKLVELEHLELGRILYGRGVPRVPTHPAHLIISTLDRDNFTWKTIHEVNFPVEPEIMGVGLSKQMNSEEIAVFWSKQLEKPARRIQLSGYQTDHLRVICDLEHQTFPNHGEMNGGIQNVPFGILNKLVAFGKPVGQTLSQKPFNPLLKQKTIHPSAPKGMQVINLPEMLLFQSKYLSIGFSLRRPMLMHLGWDILGEGHSSLNRLFAEINYNRRIINGICGLSGPGLRNLYGDHPSQLWSGEITVEGNRIIYQNLNAIAGLTIDAIFTVEVDRVTVEFTQHCAEDLPVIEAEIWRLALDLQKGITGVAGMPTQQTGRNGDVAWPVILASDGNGCLSVSLLNGNPEETRLHVESYRDNNCISVGIVFGKHPGPGHCQVIPKGKHSATFELAVTNLEPKSKPGAPEPSVALKRHWATTFACFRPEYRGFSNHSASVNCHLSQMPAIEIAAFTRHHPQGPNPLDLARFTVEKALLDGGGYGYHRNLYLDSDPVLLSAAGRIHQTDPNIDWLIRIEPGIIKTVSRMLNLVGDDGLLVCRDLTGNSGSNKWSTNYMDIIGFGHIDGYSNAWAYRAFRNAAALLDDLSGHEQLVQKCRQAAKRLRENYASILLNPKTGWIAGWKSRDGQLHDYAFIWVNGVALAFGLVDPESAQNALLGLENKRKEVGMGDARIGIPCNLLPISEQDCQMPGLGFFAWLLQPTFGTYTEGVTGWAASYYLRALARYDLRTYSKKLSDELSAGFKSGIFTGGTNSGAEYRSWEGIGTGYEGTLIGNVGPMYAIAIEEGIFSPPDPEWWPANG